MIIEVTNVELTTTSCIITKGITEFDVLDCVRINYHIRDYNNGSTTFNYNFYDSNNNLIDKKYIWLDFVEKSDVINNKYNSLYQIKASTEWEYEGDVRLNYTGYNVNFKVENNNNMGEIIAIGIKQNSQLLRGTNEISTIWLTCTTDDTEVAFRCSGKIAEGVYKIFEGITFTLQSQEQIENGNYYRVYGINVPQYLEYDEVQITAYNVDNTLNVSNQLIYEVIESINLLAPQQGTELVRGVEFYITFTTIEERNAYLWVNNERISINSSSNNGISINYCMYIIPTEYTSNVLSIRISDGVNTIDIPFKIKAYEQPKIKINSAVYNEDYLTLTTNVDYISAKIINNPIVKIDNFVTDVEYNEQFTDNNYTYTFQFNSTTYDRDIDIIFSIIGLRGEEISYTYKFKQTNNEVEEPPFVNGANISPIWQDIKYTFTEPIAEFSIKDFNSGEILYRGRSYQNPKLEPNSIYVNRLVENWISTPNFNPYDFSAVRGGYGIFDLLDANGNVLKNYQFVNDWSYNINEFKAGLLSRPILNNTYAIRGQYLPFSIFGDDDINDVYFGFKFNNGTEYKQNRKVSNDILHTWFDTAKEDAQDISFAYIGKMKIPFEEPCKNRYVLYYVNPYGGYDWFNHIAKAVERDNLQTYNYIQNVDNTTINFGKNRYLTEINKTFEFTTKWLREDESNRMWYLLESNKVWLHDVIEDRIYPIVITNTTIDYKQKTPTQKILQYTFNVVFSQQRTRK